MLHDRFFILFFIVLCIIAVADIFGILYFLFWKLWWLDLVLHFGGGFWVGGMAIWLSLYFSRFLFVEVPKPLLFFLVALTSGIALGGFWEAFQVFIDPSLSLEIDYRTDTVTDFFADIAGAILAGLYFIRTRFSTKIYNE